MSQVFLTYSLRDERAAAKIRNELCRSGLNVWWDWESGRKPEWAFEVGRALEASDSMIVLVSPHAMTSDLVTRELEYAITNERFRNRLFPVVIQPTREMPGYFSLLPMFDLTKDRRRELKRVVQAVKAGND